MLYPIVPYTRVKVDQYVCLIFFGHISIQLANSSLFKYINQ